KAPSKRNIADIRQLAHGRRRDFQRVMIRTDSLDGAKGAWAKARARPVRDTQVHRNADERDVQIGEFFLVRRIEQRREAAIRQFAPPRSFEQRLAELLHGGIVDVVGAGRPVLLAQPFQIRLVHISTVPGFMADETPQRALTEGSITSSGWAMCNFPQIPRTDLSRPGRHARLASAFTWRRACMSGWD